MNKMNQSIKEKWLAALRSGEYLKGTGFLKLVDEMDGKPKYCCLGVLCDLHQKETGKGVWNKGTYSPQVDIDSDKVLPPQVQEWAGIKDSCAFFREFSVGAPDDKYMNKTALTNLNDAIPDAKGFELVAQAIEEFF